jgi:hypothetical protein
LFILARISHTEFPSRAKTGVGRDIGPISIEQEKIVAGFGEPLGSRRPLRRAKRRL